MSVCLTGYLPFCPSVCLSVCLTAYLPFYLCLSDCLPAFLSVCLTAYLPFCLSVCLSVCLSILPYPHFLITSNTGLQKKPVLGMWTKLINTSISFSRLFILQSTSILTIVIHLHFLIGSCYLSTTVLQNLPITVGSANIQIPFLTSSTES